MELLHRIPVFISTNRDIDYWVPPVDGDALNTRSVTFMLKREIRGLSKRAAAIENSLDPPPGTITLADFIHLYEINKEAINEHVLVSIKKN